MHNYNNLCIMLVAQRKTCPVLFYVMRLNFKEPFYLGRVDTQSKKVCILCVNGDNYLDAHLHSHGKEVNTFI